MWFKQIVASVSSVTLAEHFSVKKSNLHGYAGLIKSQSESFEINYVETA